MRNIAVGWKKISLVLCLVCLCAYPQSTYQLITV